MLKTEAYIARHPFRCDDITVGLKSHKLIVQASNFSKVCCDCFIKDLVAEILQTKIVGAHLNPLGNAPCSRALEVADPVVVGLNEVVGRGAEELYVIIELDGRQR